MKQTINIGAAPDDGTGDVLRTAFDKVNDNFTELYSSDGASIKARNVTGTYVNLIVTEANINTAVGLTAVQAGAGYVCFGTFTKTLSSTFYLLIWSNGTNWFFNVLTQAS